MSIWFLSELEKDSVIKLQALIGRYVMITLPGTKRGPLKHFNFCVSFSFPFGKRNVDDEGLPTTKGSRIETPSRSARAYARILSISRKARPRVKGIRAYITALFARRKDLIPAHHLETTPADEKVENETNYKNPGLRKTVIVDTNSIRKERISHFEDAPTNLGQHNFKDDGR